MHITKEISCLKHGFLEFYEGSAITVYQIFCFPKTLTEHDRYQLELRDIASQHLDVARFEKSMRSSIQEKTYFMSMREIIKSGAQCKTKMHMIVLDNFDPATDYLEEAPLQLDTLNKIFQDTKVLIVYLIKPILSIYQDSYTQNILDRCIRQIDLAMGSGEGRAWSTITNQISHPFIVSYECAHKAYLSSISNFAHTLREERDLSVLIVDNAILGNSGVIRAINQMDQSESFVLMIDNYRLESTIIAQQLENYYTIEMKNRAANQNTMNFIDFPTCKFLIARPASSCYLKYDSKE